MIEVIMTLFWFGLSIGVGIMFTDFEEHGWFYCVAAIVASPLVIGVYVAFIVLSKGIKVEKKIWPN